MNELLLYWYASRYTYHINMLNFPRVHKKSKKKREKRAGIAIHLTTLLEFIFLYIGANG